MKKKKRPFNLPQSLRSVLDHARLRYRLRRLKNASDLDILVFKSAELRKQLEAQSIILDREAVKTFQREANYKVGVFEPHKGTQIAMELSSRVCRRLARTFAMGEPETVEALSAAWLFAVWTDIAVILPMRHLARYLHAKTPGTPILIQIPKTEITCLSYWSYNELEPLILAAELRRRGARVFLVPETGNQDENLFQGNIQLQFVANPGWWVSRVESKVPQRRFKSVLETSGMRDPGRTRRVIGEAAIVGNVRDPNSSADIHLWGIGDNPGAINISFHRAIDKEEFAVYSPVEKLPKLDDAFLRLVGQLSRVAWENAKAAIAMTAASEAHVCDHHFFEGALISHSVALAGGGIHLWPHSSNAGQVAFQKYAAIRSVTAITASAKRDWSRVVSPEIVDIDSSFMLTEAAGPRPYEEGEHVNIFMFAGAHRLNRMPTMDRASYEVTLRKFFSALAALPDCFRVHIKPKPYWEEADWLAQFFPATHNFNFSDQTAKEINLPNMLFCSVAMGSSALLEGIGRGIPALVVREAPICDYTALSPDYMQVGNVEFVIDQIRSCASPSNYELIAERNLQWYASETRFPDKSG